MGSWGVLRNEFQRAHSLEKFKCSGKIDWSEGKLQVLRKVDKGQALVATAPRFLITLHIFACLGRTCLSNCETFLILPGLVLGPPPSQSLSWTSCGSAPCSNWIHSPDFSQWETYPLWSPSWLLLYKPPSSAALSGFYCWCTQQRNFPFTSSSSPLYSSGNKPVVPWGEWKVGPFSLLGWERQGEGC